MRMHSAAKAAVAVFSVLLLAAFVCGCTGTACADAWRAVRRYIDARTPELSLLKLTREDCRATQAGSIEIDFVAAGWVDFEYDMAEATAVVVWDGKKWVVRDFYER